MIDTTRNATSRIGVIEEKSADGVFSTPALYLSESLIDVSSAPNAISRLSAEDYLEVRSRGREFGPETESTDMHCSQCGNSAPAESKFCPKCGAQLDADAAANNVAADPSYESVRAKLRNLVRITLRRYKYPPDRRDDAGRDRGAFHRGSESRSRLPSGLA